MNLNSNDCRIYVLYSEVVTKVLAFTVDLLSSNQQQKELEPRQAVEVYSLQRTNLNLTLNEKQTHPHLEYWLTKVLRKNPVTLNQKD